MIPCYFARKCKAMDITFKYNDIINRCEMLSAFEAKDKFDANGESRFLEIHINEVDKQLIQQYIIQARGILEERIGRMINSVDDIAETDTDGPGFKWTINPNTRWKSNSTFISHVTEAIVAYAMACWLKGRLDDRVAFYETLHTNTLAMAVKNIFTKQAPSYVL